MSRCVLGKECLVPSTPLHGDLQPMLVNYYVHKVVTFTCNVGYLLTGFTSIVCLDSETWDNASPYCSSGCTMQYLQRKVNVFVHHHPKANVSFST